MQEIKAVLHLHTGRLLLEGDLAKSVLPDKNVSRQRRTKAAAGFVVTPMYSRFLILG